MPISVYRAGIQHCVAEWCVTAVQGENPTLQGWVVRDCCTGWEPNTAWLCGAWLLYRAGTQHAHLRGAWLLYRAGTQHCTPAWCVTAVQSGNPTLRGCVVRDCSTGLEPKTAWLRGAWLQCRAGTQHCMAAWCVTTVQGGNSTLHGWVVHDYSTEREPNTAPWLQQWLPATYCWGRGASFLSARRVFFL